MSAALCEELHTGCGVVCNMSAAVCEGLHTGCGAVCNMSAAVCEGLNTGCGAVCNMSAALCEGLNTGCGAVCNMSAVLCVRVCTLAVGQCATCQQCGVRDSYSGESVFLNNHFFNLVIITLKPKEFYLENDLFGVISPCDDKEYSSESY